MKKIILMVIILILLAIFFMPVNADELKLFNIKGQVTGQIISDKINMGVTVPKSKYYMCLDRCHGRIELCKQWCYNIYVK